jgi:ubiquitin C-terminal hydrolase
MSILESLPILTWDGISKYYSDSIIKEPDGSVSNLQWHRFQLVWMTEKLQGNVRDPITNCLLARSQLANWLTEQLREKKLMAYGEVQYSTDEEKREAQRLGLIASYTGGPDSWDSFGGYPKNPLQVSSITNDVVFDSHNIFQRGVSVNKGSMTPISTVASPTLSLTESEESIDENPCIKGRLKYFDNKCYLDTTLTLLLTNTSSNKFRSLILQKSQEIQDSDASLPIKSFARELIEVTDRMERNEIFQAHSLVNKLKVLPNCQQYGENTPQDSQEFTTRMFDLLGIPYGPSTISRQFHASKKKKHKDLPKTSTSYSNSSSDLNNIVSRMYKIIIPIDTREYKDEELIMSIPPIDINSLGLGEDQETMSSQLLCHQIDTEISIEDSPPPYRGIVGVNNWSYSPGKRVFEKGDQTLPIDSLQYNKKQKSLMWQDEKIALTGFTRAITQGFIEKGRFVIINLTRTSPVLDASNNYTYQRMNGVQYVVAKINESRIVPEEIIRPEKSESPLRLTGLVTFQGDNVLYGHYFGFYECNGRWYKYNDTDASQITEIGTYQDLISYNNSYVQRRSVSLLYC